MIGGNLQAVNVCECAERGRPWHEKVAEQSRIWPRRRRHPDEEAIKRLRFFGRCQKIEIVALAYRLCLRSAENFPAPYNQRRPRPTRNKSAPQVRTGGRYRIAHDFTR